MATQGTATVNFGSGALEATVAVTGQSGLGAGNLVEAWALGTETIGGAQDDSVWVDLIQVYTVNKINGTGFTILAKPVIGKGFGSYNIGWVWN